MTPSPKLGKGPSTRLWAAAILLALAQGLGAASSVIYLPAAKIYQPWLGINADARDAALGGAAVAGGSEGFALKDNPAGLGLLFDSQLALAHNEWNTALGLRQEYAAFSRRLGEGGLGLALNYFSYGSFEDRDAQGAVVGGSQDSAYALDLGWGGNLLSGRMQIGMELGLAQQSLESQLGKVLSGGLGGLYELLPGLRLGAYLAEGLDSSESRPPSFLEGGLAWRPLGGTLMLAAQASRPFDGAASLGLGAEWRLLGQYSLRAGWRVSAEPAEPGQGFSAGAGLRLGSLSLDYAYVPYGELAKTHRISATLALSEGLFGSSIVIESYGLTQNAQAEYSEGLASYERRDWYVAKVAFDRALRAFPGFSKAGEIKEKLAELERRIAAEKSRGLTAEVRQKLTQRVEHALQQLEAEDYDQARRELEAVLEIDAGHKEALALLKRVQETTAAKAETLRQEAFASLAKGDLASAVEAYRQVLKVEAGDSEAQARLRKLRPKILMEVQRLHRQGIEDYINSEIEQAIDVWQKALELEPTDPYNIRRDLDKARKLLELRSGK